MINLIRNELTKIFSKKAIYIYSAIIFVLLIGVSVLSVKEEEKGGAVLDNAYIKELEMGLSSYDLSDEQELGWYVDDLVNIDSHKLLKNYKYADPEYYYIDIVIRNLISDKYRLQYIDKDVEAAKLVQEEINKEIKKIDNFDWKNELQDEKVLIEEEIKSYEEILKTEPKNAEVKSSKEDAELRLWCINYRIDNNIPQSYSSKSNFIDSYYEYATQYASVVKDESKIKNKKELVKKRQIESNYKKALYQLEHNMIGDDQDMLMFILNNTAYVDGFVVIAIIIIAGSIISEEFNKGTIKQLLIKPFSRSKILTSKIIASLIAICLFIVLYQTVFVLANCYEYGDFTSIFGNSLIYDFNVGKVREVSVMGQMLYGLLSVLPAYLIIFAIVLFVGVISTSSVAAMCAGFGVFFFADLLTLWLSEKVLSFIPFYTWNLSPYMYGGMSDNQYSSFGKSFFIDILTLLIFMALSYVLFKRKDIKNQ